MFEVVVHYNGTLVKEVQFKYIGGKVTYWTVGPDKWSYFKVVGVLKELGYIEVKKLFYCIENMLHKLYDDKGEMNMINVTKY